MYVGKWQCDGCAAVFDWFEFNAAAGFNGLVINVPAASGGRDVDLCDRCFSEVDLALCDGHFTVPEAARALRKRHGLDPRSQMTPTGSGNGSKNTRRSRLSLDQIRSALAPQGGKINNPDARP
jgi:hypothetical protein